MERRKGVKFAFGDSDPDKVIVSTCIFKDNLYIATQKGIYWLGEGDEFVRLKMIDLGEEERPLKVPENISGPV